MRIIFIVIPFLLYTTISFASPLDDSLQIELNHLIQQAPDYDKDKLHTISNLKSLLNRNDITDLNEQYNIYLKLYEEYKYYNYDSALFYAGKLKDVAYIKNDPSIIIDAKLKGVFVTLSGGMFKETFDSINVISVTHASDNVKGEYYMLMGVAYYNLADFNGDNHSTFFYNNKANLYLDSALAFYALSSFEHLYYSALKFLKKGNADSALSNLQHLIRGNNLSFHQLALTASTIGGIYISQGHEDEAKPYLTKASIADIKSSTKETLALLTLAGIMYKEGKIEEAVQYIEKANADASFYNARLRKVQVGAILPLIEGGMINTIKTQKEKLQVFLIVLSILVFLLAGFAIVIRNQIEKLKSARKSLSEANVKQQKINQELGEANELKEKYNHQLKETNLQLIEANKIKEKNNEQLEEINHKLLEANKIKEEYIGYYFYMDTEFLTRIEKLITSIDRKLIERKWEEIKFILNSVDAKKEKDELLKNFDKVFLRLFPNFVFQFNSLFKEEDRIALKEDQLLNTELRIFALIRLGIADNEKIAEILNYSINTIYSKKTKVRSKTVISKDDLERKITEITTIRF
jgi:hypothetical protein